MPLSPHSLSMSHRNLQPHILEQRSCDPITHPSARLHQPQPPTSTAQVLLPLAFSGLALLQRGLRPAALPRGLPQLLPHCNPEDALQHPWGFISAPLQLHLCYLLPCTLSSSHVGHFLAPCLSQEQPHPPWCLCTSASSAFQVLLSRLCLALGLTPIRPGLIPPCW